MWKFVTRGIRESIERRTCRSNIYSQSAQDPSSTSNDQQSRKLSTKSRCCLIPAVYQRCCGAKNNGPKDDGQKSKWDTKYTWADAVGWSSVLAIGWVVCQSICLQRKFFEKDCSGLKKWRNKLLVTPQLQPSRLFKNLILPEPSYLLAISKDYKGDGDESEEVNSGTSDNHLTYGPPTAEEALQQAADEFSVVHNSIMGELELDFGTCAIMEERYQDAIEHFEAGAGFSSAGSLFNLGLCHELGLGTSKDFSEAAKYYKRAAEKGHPDAMYNLGVFHAQGIGGLTTDLNAAQDLFQKAAKQGHPQAEKALELQKQFNKRTNHRNYNLKVKTISSNLQNALKKFGIYDNNLKEDLSYNSIDEGLDSSNGSSFTNTSVEEDDATEKFLEMLGIRDTAKSTIPLLTKT